MKIFKATLSILLALLVLVSSSSFTVNMHLCGDHVHSISVVEKPAPCAMEIYTASCHQSLTKKKSCCSEDHLTFEGKNFKSQETISLQFLLSSWMVVLPYIAKIAEPTEAFSKSQFISYSPPLVDQDITVLVQSFLI